MTDTPYRPTTPFDQATAFSKPDNVVQLEALEHPASIKVTAAFPQCAEVHKYWQGLRGSRQMPARREFDPRGIESALATTFVAEKVAPKVARIRVAGSILNDALGMEVRGMPITSLFDPCARDALAEATQEVFEGPSMSVLELSSRRGFHRKPMTARMLLLPMSDSFGNVSRLVGCLEILGGLGKSPRRFQINSLRRTMLTGEQPKAHIEEPAFTQNRCSDAPTPRYAFTEGASRFQHGPITNAKTAAPRNGLRLVVSND